MIIARRYWLNKARRKPRKHKPYHGWDAAGEVGVVLPAGTVELDTAVRAAAERWREQGKHVRLLHYDLGRVPRGKHTVRAKDTFYRNETNWKGIPGGPEVSEWLSHSYDVVLHLCMDNRGPVAFLPTMETAAVRVGPSSWKDPVLDMEVKMNPENWNTVISEIENWLKNIRYVA